MSALRRLWSRRHAVAGALVHWSGAGRVFEAAGGGPGAIVLMYHSVAGEEAAAFVDPANRIAPALFERQMRFLRRHRRVVSFSSLVEGLERGECPPPRTVAITFDDGYLDNLTVAAPVLARHGLAATLFLATGYVGRAEAQWADALHASIGRRTRHRLRIPEAGLHDADLAAPGAAAEARARLYRPLLGAGYPERTRLLAEVERQLLPAGRAPRTTMGWEDVRELRRRYPSIEVGGHTRDHLDLRAHGGELARAEVAGCAEDLRRELGIAPRWFSFPYGRWSPAARELVRASGWRAAVGAGERVRLDPASDRHALPRVEARTMTDLRFKTSGAFPGALSLLGMRCAE